MTVYAIALLKIHDRATYDRYASGFLSALAPYDAGVLAYDDHPIVMEGMWDGDRVVVLAFSDHLEFERWATSNEYQELAKDRLASAVATVLVIEGSQPSQSTDGVSEH